jgi:hypothetical protein
VQEPYLWIGYASDGVSRCRLDGDGHLTDQPLDWTHYLTTSPASPLAGDRISTMASRPGELWIGTDNGLSYQSDSGWRILRERFDGLPGNEILDVALTDDGAAWVAVRGAGVTRIQTTPSGGIAYQRFDAPELVSPDALVVARGSQGRDVWVGTSAGLSHFVPTADLTTTTSDILAIYPNPYNPACGDPVRFVELPGTAESGVIVDASGRILQRFGRKWGGDAFWDGRDPDGRPVAPGLYIVRAATPQGWLSGRIAVLDLPCE